MMDETKSDLTHDQTTPQERTSHPAEWRQDLEPNHLAGQNIGPRSAERERAITMASDLKRVHELLPGFTDDELRQIPVLPTGTRLEQGATYLDLARGKREVMKALGSMEVPADHYVIPKDRTPYPLWNRLIGEERPAR